MEEKNVNIGIYLASALGIVTPWGGDALARLRFNSAAGGPIARPGEG